MGPSKSVSAGIGGLFSNVADAGAAAALRPFNLESMAGQPVSVVFAALADVLCPAGGTIDEAIARDAMLAVAAELTTGTDLPLDALPLPALDAIFLGTIARSIEAKLINELGTRSIKLPEDIQAVQRIEQELHSFVEGSVRDAFNNSGQILRGLPQADIDHLVDAIYERSFEVLRILGENS
ncbi:hypothetical protein EN860_030560 [Mesorhizobium sp. M00.F.Ca.ET.217.01.1.1]|nr:hypothetical protein EN860_030560 [Mesorhizobium sp. M00.F.Ca.ET.217.01.1.1]TGV85442.1 hypothetical protein EN801_029265 [Mesorhizobium sp. M00.F.Ca.ET.158.01.1.1]